MFRESFGRLVNAGSFSMYHLAKLRKSEEGGPLAFDPPPRLVARYHCQLHSPKRSTQFRRHSSSTSLEFSPLPLHLLETSPLGFGVVYNKRRPALSESTFIQPCGPRHYVDSKEDGRSQRRLERGMRDRLKRRDGMWRGSCLRGAGMYNMR